MKYNKVCTMSDPLIWKHTLDGHKRVSWSLNNNFKINTIIDQRTLKGEFISKRNLNLDLEIFIWLGGYGNSNFYPIFQMFLVNGMKKIISDKVSRENRKQRASTKQKYTRHSYHNTNFAQ